MAQQRVLGYENPGFAHDADEIYQREHVTRGQRPRKTVIRKVYDKKKGCWIKKRFQIFPARFRRKYDKETGRTTLIKLPQESRPVRMRPITIRAKKKDKVTIKHNKRTGRIHVSFD